MDSKNGEYLRRNLMKRKVKLFHLVIAVLITIITLIHHINFYTDNLMLFFPPGDMGDIWYARILVTLIWGTLLFHLTDLSAIKIISTSVFIIALVSGGYGFYFQSNAAYSYSLSNALYSTIHLFILTFDPVFNDEANMYGELPHSVNIARFLAPLSTVLAIWIIGLSYFNQTVKTSFYRLVGNHILIIGSSEKATVLATNLKETGNRVVLIEKNMSSEKKEQFNKLRLVFIKGEETDFKLYRKIGLSLAKHVILLNDEDSLNLDNYLSIKKYLEQNPRKIRSNRMKRFFWKKIGNEEQMKILIHLNHAKALEIFEGLKKIDTEDIRTYSFSAYQIIAEKMLAEKPLYQSYEELLRIPEGKPLHLLFIGFGKTNQYLAFHALNISHFLTKQKMKLTILDRDIDKVMKEFKYLANEYEKVAEIHPRCVDLSATSIKTVINDIRDDITHVFLGLTDDFLDMIEGIEVAKACPNVPIFIKMKDDREVSIELDNDQGDFKQIKRYAFLNEVLTAEYVLNEALQGVAKEAHNNYRKKKKEMLKEEEKSWEDLNSFKQESTRYQMIHNDTKLMLLGLEKVSLNTPLYMDEILDENQYQEYIRSHIESLAYVEHERWNAFHYLRGWQPAGSREGTKEELEKLKLHQDLVSWRELSESSKKYDRLNVEYLRIYYEAQNYGLKKIK